MLPHKSDKEPINVFMIGPRKENIGCFIFFKQNKSTDDAAICSCTDNILYTEPLHAEHSVLLKSCYIASNVIISLSFM